ncbi:MAG: S16 family serine protease, partial [Candidatus Xenobia bacterium]
GLTAEQVSIPTDTILSIVRQYTREAGLRQLERALGRVLRKLARRVAEGATESVVVQPAQLAELLGPERRHEETLRRSMPAGVATGLAWTETGGEVLYVEALPLGKGDELTITGQLGDVMQESARAARSYVLFRARELELPDSRRRDPAVHVHVPAGATQKDGPSAGVTMATALVSAYTGLRVRPDVAMTGEITLTGLVLPVGGIKEKVLAAHRMGLRRVILPQANMVDLQELPASVRDEMTFVPAERLDEVWQEAIPDLVRRLPIRLAS